MGRKLFALLEKMLQFFFQLSTLYVTGLFRETWFKTIYRKPIICHRLFSHAVSLAGWPIASPADADSASQVTSNKNLLCCNRQRVSIVGGLPPGYI